MKKLLLVVLAAVGMAACVQNEELVAPKGDAIKFDTFVENATKVLYDNNNLSSFQVYGTISQNGAVVTNIFDGVTVTKNGSAWTYDPQYTQYWIPGFRYDFAAVVAATSVGTENGLPATIGVDMTAQNDVLYATADRDFGANDVAAEVGFTFNHLLSKAKFTVKNTITAGTGFVYSVESVKISNADKNGAYDVATGVWTATDTYEADFGVDADLAMGGSASGADVLLLPHDNKDLSIAVAYKLTYNGATLINETKTLTTIFSLEQGKAYNFIVELGNPGDKVVFKPEVEDWVDGANQGAIALVSSAAEFQNAVNNDDVTTVVLAEDINLADLLSRAADPSLKVNNGKVLTLDLGGHKLSATSYQSDKNYDMIDVNNATLTVKNGTIEYKHEGTDMAWNASINIFNITNGGVLNLDGVTAKNLGGSAMAFVAHLNNWGECTLNVENSTLESTYIAVRVFNSGYDMNNVTIENSTLKGKFCFWVHNYKAAGDAVGTDETLNVVFTNVTFENTGKAPILYGFANPIYKTADGYVAAATADELASLVSNAKSDIEIALTADLEGKIELWQNAAVNITINGKDKKYAGAIRIINLGGATDRSLTIKNVHFDGTGLSDKEGCIYSSVSVVVNNQNYNSYFANVIVEDCTFTGAGVAAIRQNNGGDINLTVKNCSIDNTMHSFVQAKNFNTLTIEDCETYSKNGVNLNNTYNASFTGCNFDVQGYAVRVGVNDDSDSKAKTYNFTGCTLKSANDDGDAVVIIRKTAQNATLNFVNTELIGDPMISGNTANTKITGIALPQQNNEIWYTATTLVHAHFYKDRFGEGTDLVSNVWDETTGKGVITLSGDVTKIGQNAFYYDGFHDSRENLISISLPNTVTEIGEDAFKQCPNLTTVTFNNNLVTIGPGAFGGCKKLTNVVLPESLTTIGNSAFNSCTSLKSITIPAGVTSIGSYAFNGISEIKVYCKPTTPPTVGSTPFNQWWAEIYVPTASLADYQSAWGSVVDNIYDGKF